MWESQPDLVVISGDFVQSGRRAEFKEAKQFVDQLPKPRLMVPGNHDLPFANLWKRLTVGLDYYRDYICDDLEPFFEDEEIAVMGVNTARPWPLRGGRINRNQIRRVEEKLCALESDVTKLLVTHHPFDLEESYNRRELVGRARLAMGRFAQSVDLLLAGHMHVTHSGRTAVRYKLKGASAIFVQAGTATSTRGRGEPNTFNLIKVQRPFVAIECQQWDPARQRFRCACTDRFTLEQGAPVCLPEEVLENIGEEEVDVVYSGSESDSEF